MSSPPPAVAEFLQGPRVAALATVRPDGRPHVTPVWYEYDGTEFIVSTFRASQKLRNIRHKGFACLCIYSREIPYRQVIVEGTARAGGPLDNVSRLRLATRYLGEAAAKAYVRDTADWDVASIWIRPVRWITEGFQEEEE